PGRPPGAPSHPGNLGRDVMADDPDIIQNQIEQTRTALAEKLEALGDQISDTVEEAKETVEGTIDSVTSTGQETVHTVKRTVDLRYQVRQRPWLFFGGSVLAGFALGRLTGRGNAGEVIRRGVDTVSGPIRGAVDRLRQTAESSGGGEHAGVVHEVM